MLERSAALLSGQLLPGAPLAMATGTSVLWNTLFVAMTAGSAFPDLEPKSELGLLLHGCNILSGRFLLLVYGYIDCIPLFVQP